MFDEYMKGLEKKLCKLEEEITGKKQRKYIRNFKDHQAGRILTFQRKYDHMYESSTDVEVRNTERRFWALGSSGRRRACFCFCAAGKQKALNTPSGESLKPRNLAAEPLTKMAGKDDLTSGKEEEKWRLPEPLNTGASSY
ncbi:hypothetical protein NDU88_003097 [Pleurodeles waltl]|uniref:Uncharacterized protein n=1 Tax=Pleurodeles waltl TaxID=8319 RepID=A0AAV7LHU5_PLEWA|nr:hypothetical protein NDU88_003097 [Pleurodeles waltl]